MAVFIGFSATAKATERIQVDTGETLTVEGTPSFNGISNSEGGAAVQNSGVLTLGDNVKFTNNSSTIWGGAIATAGLDKEGIITTIGDNAVFTSNTAGA